MNLPLLIWLLKGLQLALACTAAWLEVRAREKGVKLLSEERKQDLRRSNPATTVLDWNILLTVTLGFVVCTLFALDLSQARYDRSAADALTFIPLIYALVVHYRRLQV
ncbi:MAG: hypothetical protein WC551_06990 [Patescibacteria group bacterium]